MDPQRIKDATAALKRHALHLDTEEDLALVEHLLTASAASGEPLWSRVRRTIDVGRKLLDLTRAINAERDLGALLERIVDAAIELCGAERGMLILGSAEPFVQHVARRFGGEDLGQPVLQFSRTIATRAIAAGKVILLDDAMADLELAQKPSVLAKKLRSIMAGPLRGRDGVLGVLYVDNRFAQGLFGPHHQERLSVLCDQAAVALDNAGLHKELVQRRVEVEQLNARLCEKLERMESLVDNQRQQLFSEGAGYHGIMGSSARMRELFAVIDKIRDSDLPVLIEGESGTGKELVARAVHQASRRATGAYVSENCAAIPESLLESELFGHMPGAFTGADKRKQGLLELASGGTLFLDEVADMGDAMQKKLLRALQEGTIRPVGAKAAIPVDVRVISACNKPLKTLVADGRFREDLYYRLAGITLELPPLRARKEDIPVLVEHFLEHIARARGTPPKRIDREALDALLRCDWPGNIRQLKNEVEALVALSEGNRIRLEHVSAQARGVDVRGPAWLGEGEHQPLEPMIERIEKEAIVRALAASSNKSEAATLLSISRYAFNRKLAKYGLDA